MNEAEDNRCHVFLCYRQADGLSAAEWLYEHLHGQVIQLERSTQQLKLDVYFDRDAPAVDDWQTIWLPKLQASRALLFICTAGSARRRDGTDWVYKELDHWAALRTNGPIIVSVTEGTDESLPSIVRERWPNAQRIVCPLEIWEQMPEAEKLKVQTRVVSRILRGIQISEEGYWIEELERQKLLNQKLKRRLYAAIFLLSIALLLAGLFAFAEFRAGQNAKRARSERNRAEDLAGFMLSDMKDSLQSVGRLDLLKSVAEKADRYYQSLPKEDLSPDVLHQRQRALAVISKVLTEQGQLPRALETLNSSLEIWHQLHPETSRSAEDRKQLASLYFELSQICFRSGDLATARANLEKSKDMYQAVSEQNPGDEDARAAIARSYEGMASLEKHLRHFDEAFALTMKAHEILKEQFERLGPQSKFAGLYQASLAEITSLFTATDRLEGAADLLQRLMQGLDGGAAEKVTADPKRAGTVYESLNQLRQIGPQLLDSMKRKIDSGDQPFRFMFSYAVLCSSFARVLVSRDEVPDALTYYQRSITMLLALENRDPTNAEWKGMLGFVLSQRGNIHYGRSNFQAASEDHRLAVKYLADLDAKQNPKTFELSQNLIAERINVARALQALEQWNEAESEYLAVLSLAKERKPLEKQSETLRDTISQAISIVLSFVEALRIRVNLPELSKLSDEERTALLQQSVRLLSAMADVDPANTPFDVLRQKGGAQHSLAKHLAKVGKRRAASDALRELFETSTVMIKRFPEELASHMGAYLSLDEETTLVEEDKNWTEAIQIRKRSIAIMEEALRIHPKDEKLRTGLQSLREHVAELEQKAKEPR